MRSRPSSREPIGVSLNAIVAEIAGRKSGKRYAQIEKLTHGLHKLGLILDRKIGDRHRITLIQKKVKYLRGLPRRREDLRIEPT